MFKRQEKKIREYQPGNGRPGSSGRFGTGNITIPGGSRGSRGSPRGFGKGTPGRRPGGGKLN